MLALRRYNGAMESQVAKRDAPASDRPDLVFRRYAAEDAGPAAGELVLRPRPALGETVCRQLALLALEKGLDAFLRGDGPVRHIVVQADPTLDDMLAALIVERLAMGLPLPAGLRACASYAANAREGLKATDLPLQDSLEGIYLAIRQQAGADLTDCATSVRFLEDWRRLAERIVKAAEAGQNPATTSLFGGDPEFARARAYLAKDREVYAQQDVPRGERWRVRLPEGPPEAAGLLLRQPRSVLWKYWAREDPAAPLGQGYLFLAVYEQERHWRFSTNPVLRVPIGSLAALLQKEEAARDAARAAHDPWYDGKRHAHTLVAAPHAGTLLAEEDVLKVVRRWARVQPPEVKRLPWKKLAAVPAAALVFVAAVLAWNWLPRGGDGPGPTWKENLARGMEVVWPKDAQAGTFKKGKDYALLIATDEYDRGWYKLNNPTRDARKLASLLEGYGFETKLVLNPTWEQMWDALEDTVKDPETKKRREYDNGDQLLIFIAGHGDYDAENWQGCLVARDSDQKDQRKQRYLKFAELRSKIETHPCKHVLLVLDVCYAGAIDPFASGLPWSKTRGDKALPLEQLLALKMKAATRHYITSCRLNETPDGAPGEHSPFAAHLIKDLEAGLKKKEFRSLNHLWLNVSHLDPVPARGSFYWDGLTPEGGKEMSDFLFVPKGLAGR